MYRGARTGDSSEANNPWLKISYLFWFDCTGGKSGIKALPVIGPDEGLQLKAIVDHIDGEEERKAGDMWQLEGPLTYRPTPYAVR